MKIVVCVKQVLDTAARIAVADGRVDPQGGARVLNPYDEFAVEEAVLLREKFPDTEIDLVTLGPESFKEALRSGLAMGADRATHLLDPAFDALDALGVAKVLAKAVGGMQYDLILCGRQAVDDDMAQVGPALAVRLGIPFVAVVTKLEIGEDQKQAVVHRQIEGGTEILEAPLPLLLTCQKGLNEPRLPKLKGIMAAKKKEIKIMDAAALGIDPQSLAGDARVRQIDLTLPPQRKGARMLEGEPREVAAQLAHILREEEKLI